MKHCFDSWISSTLGNADSEIYHSFDTPETYAQKLSFANELCLGGMMVWAVDLNNQSTLTGYGSQANTSLSDTATSFVNQQSVNTQAGMACYTSQCGADCMSGYSGVTNMNGQPGYLPTAEPCSGDVETLCCASGTTLGTCTWRGWRGQGLPCSGGCNSGETLVAQNTNHHDTVNGVLEDQTCNGGLQSYCCEGFVAPSTLHTSTEDLSQEDLSLNTNPFVSVVVATVTEAIANAAKSVLDAVATDFCEVAVPAFLAPLEDIELAIPSKSILSRSASKHQLIQPTVFGKYFQTETNNGVY
jgi:chitinase